MNDDIMSLEEKTKQWLSEEDMLREVKYDENADFHFISKRKYHGCCKA